MKFTFDDISLKEGMNRLVPNIKINLGGSVSILVSVAKENWSRTMSPYGTLSKGRNGREWFSQDKKTWYITNQWTVPDPIWAGRNFIIGKRKQAEKSMKVAISSKKQAILNDALGKAIDKF